MHTTDQHQFQNIKTTTPDHETQMTQNNPKTSNTLSDNMKQLTQDNPNRMNKNNKTRTDIMNRKHSKTQQLFESLKHKKTQGKP